LTGRRETAWALLESSLSFIALWEQPEEGNPP
jgi:hypothetical protein